VGQPFQCRLLKRDSLSPKRLLPLCLSFALLPTVVASLALLQCYSTLLASFHPLTPFHLFLSYHAQLCPVIPQREHPKGYELSCMTRPRDVRGEYDPYYCNISTCSSTVVVAHSRRRMLDVIAFGILASQLNPEYPPHFSDRAYSRKSVGKS
jgi:hypothetical protein